MVMQIIRIIYNLTWFEYKSARMCKSNPETLVLAVQVNVSTKNVLDIDSVSKCSRTNTTTVFFFVVPDQFVNAVGRMHQFHVLVQADMIIEIPVALLTCCSASTWPVSLKVSRPRLFISVNSDFIQVLARPMASTYSNHSFQASWTT